MALLLFLLLLLLLLLLPLLSLLLLTQRNKKPSNSLHLLPSPPQLPIIGNLHQLSNLPHRSLAHLSHHHGPLMHLRLGRTPAIVVSSATMAKEFLKTHDLNCSGRPPFASWTKLSYGCSDIVCAPYGDRWRELRKISITELFSNKKIQSFQSLRKEETEKMINSISDLAANLLVPIDLSEMLLALSKNIICRAALGARSWDGVHHMLREAQAMLGGFFIGDYLPEFSWMDRLTGMRVRLDKIFLELDAFYEEVIKKHLIANGNNERALDHEDITDALLRVKRDEGFITDDHIKGVLMNVFIAGADTSSSAIEWAMVELMRHPTVMKKAQYEVRSFIGSKKGKVEEDDLYQLPYLKMVVKETMRLHPPAPLLVQRETMRDFNVGGYEIPAKTMVIVNAWAIGRDSSCWEKPEEFNPERFAESSVDMKGHDFQLIPFGAGRRICPGMQFGLLTVELGLANLLCFFDWELPKGTKEMDMDEAVGITVHKKYPLMLVATKYEVGKCYEH